LVYVQEGQLLAGLSAVALGDDWPFASMFDIEGLFLVMKLP
jgi:hypothetical protein